MAQLWTTGPAHFFVGLNRNPPTPVSQRAANAAAAQNAGLNGGGQIKAVLAAAPKFYYLGTAETKPIIELRKAHSPVYNDLNGKMIPFDKLYEGEEAYVFADLNRFNHNVMEAMAEYPAIRNLPGLDEAGDIGTLVLTEGQQIWLVVWFPYATKPAYRAAPSGSMRLGYRFPAATYEGPEKQEIGTTPWKRQCIWHCIKAYLPGNGRSILYDQQLGGLPAVD